MTAANPPWVGRSVERVEDAALLTGTGRFADDYPLPAGGAHAAFLRSPYPHADILSVDSTAALALEGVLAVVTGEDVQAWTQPFIVGVKQPMRHWCLAVDRVRYVGEPVAVVVAADRYVAEDALELIVVDYAVRPAVVDARASLETEAPTLHDEVGANLVHDRTFCYGDPAAAFADAAIKVGVSLSYPRNSATPIEGFVVTAHYHGAEQAYEVVSNFQGPFSLHPVMARALKVPGPRLRLRSPADSGGSFGIKQGVFPAVVALALAARKAGVPVRWVEDRIEHLAAAGSATNRAMTLEAAVTSEGKVTALRYDQIDDCGAYLRAPEPATLYRMHGNLTGAYAIGHLAVRNRVVLTNKAPTGLNRGFGGPQVYFALETLMRRIADELDLTPLEVIRRNLVPAEEMPYRTASGALLDSGDYEAVVDLACGDRRYEGLLERRRAARAEGRWFGVGCAAVVEPSISNMGYITALLTPQERERAGPKNGGTAIATVSVDPSGGVAVTAASTPQGQGHRTVLAQVVADVLGLAPGDITVNLELDTQKDAWTIASGNYSSRFAGAVAGTAHQAAIRVRDKLARIAAPALNARPDDLRFAAGRIFESANPDNGQSLARVAGIAHWSPGALPPDMAPGVHERVAWTMPELEPPDPEDKVNSSGAYGFLFDLCTVEIDPDTAQVRIDTYITAHDAGRRLNPALVDGQIRGGFAQALGAALLEELKYDEEGNFLSGTLADYLIPTSVEVVEPLILHLDHPSPFTPLGAKGVGEGNSMSTPVCLANAVADALGLHTVELPLTPLRVARYLDAANPGQDAAP